MENSEYFIVLVVILLAAFKAIGFIDWGWAWILAPIWAPLLFGLLVVVVLTALAVLER